jgi:rubrerythrin
MKFAQLAQQLENKTISAYEALAGQCSSHEGVRRILLMLVEDHKKHVDELGKATDQGDEQFSDPSVFEEVRRLLEKIQTEKDTFSCDIDQLKLYREARDLVLEKKQFYQEVRDKTEGGSGRNFLDTLIKEEEKQAFVLNNIIEMVERPDHWLEDAEFSHLDEY